MKYFIQFEGNEKLVVKIILGALLAIIILLVALLNRPVFLYLEDEQWEVYNGYAKKDNKKRVSEELRESYPNCKEKTKTEKEGITL